MSEDIQEEPYPSQNRPSPADPSAVFESTHPDEPKFPEKIMLEKTVYTRSAISTPVRVFYLPLIALSLINFALWREGREGNTDSALNLLRGSVIIDHILGIIQQSRLWSRQIQPNIIWVPTLTMPGGVLSVILSIRSNRLGGMPTVIALPLSIWYTLGLLLRAGKGKGIHRVYYSLALFPLSLITADYTLHSLSLPSPLAAPLETILPLWINGMYILSILSFLSTVCVLVYSLLASSPPSQSLFNYALSITPTLPLIYLVHMHTGEHQFPLSAHSPQTASLLALFALPVLTLTRSSIPSPRVPRVQTYPLAGYTRQSIPSTPLPLPSRCAQGEIDTACILCTHSRADTIPLDCMHTGICHQCMLTHIMNNRLSCPVCRQRMHTIVRVSQPKVMGGDRHWIMHEQIHIE